MKLLERLNEYPEWTEISDRRNNGHIEGVKYFGKRIGKNYNNHDDDKFGSLYLPYIFITLRYNPDIKDKLNMDEDMEKLTKWASFHHVKNNKHHPEYWDSSVKEGEQKTVDATKMPDEYIIEMCCDWSSVGAENGGSPQDWFEKNNGKRWKFTKDQEDLINETLEKLWPGGYTDTRSIKHEERYFNDKLVKKLVSEWGKFNSKNKIGKLEEDMDLLDESIDSLIDSIDSFNETMGITQGIILTEDSIDYDDEELLLENMTVDNSEISKLIDDILGFGNEKEEFTEIAKKVANSNFEPVVNLVGVNSLQNLSFLFSPTITNYLTTLIDSMSSGDFSNLVDPKVLNGLGLGNIELGINKTTKAKITNNFINGLIRSMNSINNSKLKSKVGLSIKFLNNLNSHAKTIKNKMDKKEYMENVKAFKKVMTIIQNIIKNRNNFKNVLKQVLSLEESNKEIYSYRFVNIYEGL